jgi:hypothetical protein
MVLIKVGERNFNFEARKFFEKKISLAKFSENVFFLL